MPTLFGLQANVTQRGREAKGEGVEFSLLEPEQSTEIARSLGLEQLTCRLLGGAGGQSSRLL